MANKMLVADRYVVALSRSCDIAGERYLFGDEVEVLDTETVRQLVDDGLATVISYEWDNGPVMNGASVQFRKL
jgi:hypothetical protein